MKKSIAIFFFVSFLVLTSCDEKPQAELEKPTTKQEAYGFKYPIEYQVMKVNEKIHLTSEIMDSATIGPFIKIRKDHYAYYDPQNKGINDTATASLYTDNGKEWWYGVNYRQSIAQPVDVSGSPLDSTDKKR